MKTKLLHVLFFLSLVVQAQIPVTNGLYGSYEFTNGSYTDAANATHLTSPANSLISTTSDRFSIANNAIDLSRGGILERPNVDFPDGNFLSSNNGSISFWIKTNTNDTNKRIIIGDSNSPNLNSTTTNWSGYYIFLKNGKIGISTSVRYSDTNLGYRGATKIADPFVSDNNWHHIVITIGATGSTSSSGLTDFMKTRARIYIDGIDYGMATIDDSGNPGSVNLSESHDTNGNFRIGNPRALYLPLSNRYIGSIDDIYIYNRQITQVEVTQLSTVNNFCFPPAVNTITASNITETTADISWTQSGTCDLAYLPKGQAFSNATIIPNFNYTANTVHSLIGLLPSTVYEVYIRKVCISPIKSSWSTPKEFKTNGIIYVNKNATGNNDGTSWTNAYTDLQDAFKTTSTAIWVAKGTYIPHTSDKTVSFKIDNPETKLYGGFNGTETALNQRDFRANETILSGDLYNNDNGELIGNKRSDNSYHVVVLNRTASNPIIDGFTISGGHGSLSLTSGYGLTNYRIGGGIYKLKQIHSLTVKNCIIKNNVAQSGAGISAEYETATGSLIIENCIFDNNLARHSSAYLAIANNYSSGAFNIRISNSIFSNNEAKDLGGSLGHAASAGWIRTTSSGTNITALLTNNTYVNNNDIGTHSSMNNFNRATVGATATNGTINLRTANCIFWNNTMTGGVVANSITGIHQNIGLISAWNSISQDGFSNLSPSNLTNISTTDPLFKDISVNDFTLTAASTAINGGSNSFINGGTNAVSINRDILGNDRISSNTVDIGAYEFDPTTPILHKLEIQSLGGGTVNHASSQYYNDSSIVNLTAIPDPGYFFTGWSEDAIGTINPLGVVMSRNKTIIANFSKRIYVDKNATGNNDGTSWINAHTDLYSALIQTSINAEIWVAAGTYTVPNNIDRTFFVNDDKLKIYGGFSGTEVSLSERDVTNNTTILSGDRNGDDSGTLSFGTSGTRTDNSFRILTIVGNDCLIDGFTIQSGNANGNTSQRAGAAIYKTGSVANLAVKNCVFQENISRNGGIIFASYNTDGSLVIENCVFDTNLARYGTAIYAYSNTNIVLDVSVTNSLFINNKAQDNGTELGYSGSAGWYRALNGGTINANFTNNTYANNLDIGTHGNIIDRATVGLNKDGNSTLNASVSNCIFYNNKELTNTIAKAVGTPAQNAAYTQIFNSLDTDNFSTVTTSNKQNILTNNPLFTDAANHDFTLQANSPAINTGDNSKIPTGITIDLSGNTRIHNTTVDMGAYEFGSGSTLSNSSFSKQEKVVKLYPNPVTDYLSITSDTKIEAISIYSIQGKSILKTNNTTIYLGNLKTGIYIACIKTADTTVYKKIIKK